jgi:hypothetical protein
MINSLLQASVIRFHEAKDQSLLYWTESGKCRYCTCTFSPTDLLRQQVKMLHICADSEKKILAYKK